MNVYQYHDRGVYLDTEYQKLPTVTVENGNVRLTYNGKKRDVQIIFNDDYSSNCIFNIEDISDLKKAIQLLEDYDDEKQA